MSSIEEVSSVRPANTPGTSAPAGTRRAAEPARGSLINETRWLSDEEQLLWRRLLRAESQIHDLLDRDLREAHKLTLGGYAVLVHLADAGPDGLRMSDLADLLVISRSGLTRRVSALVRTGLVARRSCPIDRRGTFAALTPAGRAMLAEAAPTHVEGVRRYLIDPIGDLSLLESGLARVESVLQKSARRDSVYELASCEVP